jgi:hypothetical protein
MREAGLAGTPRRRFRVTTQADDGMVPRIEGNPILPVAGFVLADLLLLALALWDWRANRRFIVFPVALGVLLVYHTSVLTLYRVPLWNSLCVWFLSLPLS